MTEKLKLEQLGRISVEEFKNTEKMPFAVALDDVRSMHNVGSVFRTADAFLAEKIFLCGITPRPPQKEIQKVALGATESVDWEYFADIKQVLLKLKSENYKIIGIEQTTDSKPISEFLPEKNKKYALVFGNEVDGLSENILDLCDIFLEIPQLGTKHSLNISVCAGIVLWEFFRKIKN